MLRGAFMYKETTMDIKLYTTQQPKNCVVKIANPSSPNVTLSGVLKDNCSMMNPVVLIDISSPGTLNGNYAFMNNRWYWIEDIVYVHNTLAELHLKEDSLFTFKNAIRVTNGVVEKYDNSNNTDIIQFQSRFDDGTFRKVALPDGITEFGFSNISSDQFDYDHPNYILCVAGGTGGPESYDLNRVYVPSESQLEDFADWLWNVDITSTFTDFWKLFNDPIQSVVSLSKVYCTVSTTRSTGIIMGSNHNTGVYADALASRRTHIDYSASVDELAQNYSAYPPYASATLYLPFVGFVPIDLGKIIRSSADNNNKTLYVHYNCDVITGACSVIVTIKYDMESVERPLATFAGNVSETCTISGNNASMVLMNTVSSLAKLGISAGTGNVRGAIGDVAGMIGQNVQTEMQGTVSGNAGALALDILRYPRIIVDRKRTIAPNDYDSYLGRPTYQKARCDQMSGKVKFVEIYKPDAFSGLAPNLTEWNEIESYLKSGVILPTTW